MEKALGRKVRVYTVADIWKECLRNTSSFADRPLWLAGYPGFDPGLRPGFGGWQRWVFYQYKGNLRLGQGVLDLDVFRGDQAALRGLLRKNEPWWERQKQPPHGPCFVSKDEPNRRRTPSPAGIMLVSRGSEPPPRVHRR